MKRITLILGLALLTGATTTVVAQDKKDAQTKTESVRAPENVKKEADALKARIDQYVEKIEANKDNPSIDYEAEMGRIAEMRTHYEAVKSEWEELSGKKWVDEKKEVKK